MEFTSDTEMRKIQDLTQELFDHVLHDEKPLFIGDEATIWDVSMSTATDLLARCLQYYGKPVSMADLNQPLWRLLRQLNEGRNADGLRQHGGSEDN